MLFVIDILFARLGWQLTINLWNIFFISFPKLKMLVTTKRLRMHSFIGGGGAGLFWQSIFWGGGGGGGELKFSNSGGGAYRKGFEYFVFWFSHFW